MRRALIGLGLLLLVGCGQQPQPVRRLNDKQGVDSILLAQMTFNMQMSSAADKACRDWVQKDSLKYTLDEFGYWYAKTTNNYSDTLQIGETAMVHLQIEELNGQLLADVKEVFAVGASELPVAVNRSMKQMGKGEQMRIVAPWYTAYGTEGTKIIKPYTNIVITLTISNE